jgi:ribosomal protein S18 acetylase RimI-like enzyme
MHEASDVGRIVSVTSPSEHEIAQMLALKEKCEQRLGIGILLTGDMLRTLERTGYGALAFLREGRYIGLSFFYSYEKEEAEALLFADPDEDWRSVTSLLLAATVAACKSHGHATLLVMNDRRQSSAVEQIEAAGGKLAFSEHHMDSRTSAPISGQYIELREVGNDDAGLREIELACHSRFYSKPDQARYLALFENAPIGKIDVCLEGTKAELTGFCVLPGLRGRGLGKAILQTMVGVLKGEGRERISLDVQTDNDVALSLYLKSGFERQFTIDYYGIPLEDMIRDERHP